MLKTRDSKPRSTRSMSRPSSSRRSVVESMEPRQLLSASWATVDDFQSEPDRYARSRSIAVDAAGTAYAGGLAQDADGITRAVVRVRPEGSTQWATAGSYRLDSAGGYGHFLDIAVVDSDHSGAADTIYGVGRVGGDGSHERWVTAKSIDGGASWATVDQFRLPGSTKAAVANAVDVDPAGNVYVVGEARDMSTSPAAGAAHWVVRKSSDGGATWNTIQDFRLQSGYQSYAKNIVATDSAVYVVGEGGTSKGSRWLVQKMPAAGGGGWTMVDSFQLATNETSKADAIAVDAAGNLFVAGSGTKARSGSYWMVRKARPDGTGWATLDTFQLSPSGSGYGGAARAVATDANGNVYVAGTSSVGSAWHSVVRHSADGGASWVTSDDYVRQVGQDTQSYGVACDPVSGKVLIAGDGYASNPTTGVASAHWLVRELAVATPSTSSTSGGPTVGSVTEDQSETSGASITQDVLSS